MTLCPVNDRITVDNDRLQERCLVHLINRTERIKFCQFLLRFFLDALQSSLKDLLIIMHPLNR